MSNDSSDDDAAAPYPVGYKRPPVEHRFQPGRSGNPRGRKKRSKNLQTLLDQELDSAIVVKERGRERRISKREAIVKQLVTNALKGDRKVLELLLRSQRVNPHPEPIECWPGSDQDWEEFLKRQIASSRQEECHDSSASDVQGRASDDDVPE